MTPLVHFSRPAGPACRRLAMAAALLLAAPALQAQYKVIGADGKVTYSDRVPNPADGRASALGARAPTQAAEPDLPFELRQTASKYPVTLYTTKDTCDPCVQARNFLKQRGIPFVERQAVSTEDIDTLEKLSGGREAPTVTIGSQVLRGLAADTWSSYLDAAGYPKDSKLPGTYQYRPPTPMTERREAAASRPGEAVPAAAPARPATPRGPSTSGSIRF